MVGRAVSQPVRVEEDSIVSQQPVTSSTLSRRSLLAGSAAAAGATALGPRVGQRRYRARAQSPVEITMWGFPLTQDD